MASDFMGGSGFDPADVVRTCDWEHSVSDDAFGYWHESWGDVPVHTFTCSEPAMVVLTVICQHGADEVALCASHFREVL
jgi:hypothetical protein